MVLFPRQPEPVLLFELLPYLKDNEGKRSIALVTLTWAMKVHSFPLALVLHTNSLQLRASGGSPSTACHTRPGAAPT